MSHTLLTPLAEQMTCSRCGSHQESGFMHCDEGDWSYHCASCAALEIKVDGGDCLVFDHYEALADRSSHPDFKPDENQDDFETTIMSFTDRNSRISQRIC